ncbi:22560_t:CDS:2, partial [Gigaspora margarita]
NENTNYRCPLCFPDNEGHIVKYLYIKITKRINILVDKRFRPLLKTKKIFIKNNELHYEHDKYLLELLFPYKRENIRFKNSYMYDLHPEIEKDIKLSKKEEFWWFRDNEKQNYRKPVMFPDDDGHITEYLQIKLTKDRNFFIDKKYKPLIKNYKLNVDKENNIFDEKSKAFLLEIIYPQTKIDQISFKNRCKFDLRDCVFFDDNNPKNLSERLPGEQQTNNRAELYAAIRALEIVDNEQDMIVFTDSTYVINCCNVRNPKKNFDLVNRLNDLLKERKEKSIFKHVRGHSGVYENEQADRLAYLDFQKTDVKEFNFPKRKDFSQDWDRA